MRRRSASGTPVAVIDDRDAHGRAVVRRVQAERIVRIDAARVLEQVHEHLAHHRLIDADRGQRRPRRRRRRPGPRAPPRRRRRRRRAAPRRASACGAGGSAPASMRERSSMLSTRRTRRRASCSMPSSSASRSLSGTDSRRAEAEAVIAVSGVRRSCETDCRSAARRRSVSLNACSWMPSYWSCARPSASPRMPQNDSSTASVSASSAPVARVDRQQPERDAAVGDGQRHQPVVSAQAHELRLAGRVQRVLEPRAGGARRRRSARRSRSSRDRRAQRRAAQPERAAEVGERAAQGREQVVAADQAHGERLQLLHVERPPRRPPRSRCGTRSRSSPGRARSGRR